MSRCGMTDVAEVGRCEVVVLPRPYSARSATTGTTRVARHEGSIDAISATKQQCDDNDRVAHDDWRALLELGAGPGRPRFITLRKAGSAAGFLESGGASAHAVVMPACSGWRPFRRHHIPQPLARTRSRNWRGAPC